MLKNLSKGNKKIIKWFGIFIVSITAFIFWYVSVPILMIWLIWKKTNWDKYKKYIGITLSIIIGILLFWSNSYINRTPSFIIIEPENKISIQAKEIRIKGEVDPKNAILEINNRPIAVTKDGIFDYRGSLRDKVNNFSIKVINKSKDYQETIIINRIFTEEEKIKYEKQKEKYRLERQTELKIEQEKREVEQRNKLIEEQFSVWDGSHIKLTRLIKDSMNDPKSYEHVETLYWDLDDYIVVSTTFRGSNAFGAIIKNSIKAKISIDGENIEIIE